MKSNTITGTLLIISVALLTLMIPGGPVETRGFSHYPAIVIASFNTFLTVLGILNIAVIYFVFRNRKWTVPVSIGVALAYMAVYGLDLLEIFPVSPDAMPMTLMSMEIAGLAISIPIIYFALRMGKETSDEIESPSLKLTSKVKVLLILTIILAMGIITFATFSAM